MTPLLLSAALKGLIVLVAAFGLLAVLRAAPPALRHAVWTAAFAALLLVPALDAFAPALGVPVLPAPRAAAPLIDAVESREVIIAELPPSRVPAGGLVLSRSDVESLRGTVDIRVQRGEVAVALPRAGRGRVTRPASPVSGLPVGWMVFAVWALGAGVVGARWAAAYASAAFVVQGARAVTDEGWLDGAERARRLLGLDREVRLLVSDRLDVPVAWGFGTPAVVLPPDADGWDEDRRDAVLLHELAHVRRADARTQLVAQLALALHWPNPLAWLAYRRFLVEREHACDDAVLSGGATPSAYARHLVDIARGATREPHTLAALAPMARRSDLERRVVAVLDAGRRRVAAGRGSLMRAVALGLTVAAPLGVLHPVAAASDAAPAPPAAPRVPEPPAASHAHAAALEPPPPRALDGDPPPAAALSDELAEAMQDTIPLARDVLGPARKRTLAQLRQMRADGLGLDSEAWDHIEREVEAAFDEAHADYDAIVREAIEAAVEDANGTLLSAADLRGGALAQRGGAADRARRQAVQAHRQDERHRAQRQAHLDREQALREATRSRHQALRRAELDRQRALREADRARQKALIEGRRTRERALRRAAQQRRRALGQATSTRSRSAATARPGAGYAYSTGPDGVTVPFSTSPGVGAWMAQLDGLDDAIEAVVRSADNLNQHRKVSPSDLAGLAGGLAGIEGAVAGIASADAWARSDTERAVAQTRIDATRARLRAARRHLEVCETD